MADKVISWRNKTTKIKKILTLRLIIQLILRPEENNKEKK